MNVFYSLLLVGTRDLRPVRKRREKKKKKNPGINPGQPARKGRGKKTLGRSGAYIVNPPEKGEKKTKKTMVLTLGSPPKKGGKKTLVLTLGNPPDLYFRTWVSGPQDLGFTTQTDARNASYSRLIFFPSFFSTSTITFLFPVT